MFTGIIECTGHLEDLRHENSNIHFSISSPISHELKVDQSVAHDGVCLTVTRVDMARGTHEVTAILETLQKTNLGTWKKGELLNLERCMKLGDRLDGHIVQGHVDQTAVCIEKKETDGSWLFTFQYEQGEHVTVEKGSVCVNGTSLTVVNSLPDRFSVAIIPYTFDNTKFSQIKPGDTVNLEFDIIGKYISRLYSSHQKEPRH